MRILTIKQPWATLIIDGHKWIENRTWSTRYRGTIAIHSSLVFDDSEYALKTFRRHMSPDRDFLKGYVIGTVELTDVVDDSSSPWFDGPYGLIFEDARALRSPFRRTGQQGLRDLSPREVTEIKARMMNAR